MHPHHKCEFPNRNQRLPEDQEHTTSERSQRRRTPSEGSGASPVKAAVPERRAPLREEAPPQLAPAKPWPGQGEFEAQDGATGTPRMRKAASTASKNTGLANEHKPPNPAAANVKTHPRSEMRSTFLSGCAQMMIGPPSGGTTM